MIICVPPIRRTRSLQRSMEACLMGRALSESLQALNCSVISPGSYAHISTILDPNAPADLLAEKRAIYKKLQAFLPTKNLVCATIICSCRSTNQIEAFGHDTIGMPPQPRTLPNFEGQGNIPRLPDAQGLCHRSRRPARRRPRAPFSSAMFGFAKARSADLSL